MTAHCKGTLNSAGTLLNKPKPKVHCQLLPKVSNEQDLYN